MTSLLTLLIQIKTKIIAKRWTLLCFVAFNGVEKLSLIFSTS